MTEVHVACLEAVDGQFTQISTFSTEIDNERLLTEMAENKNLLGPVTIPHYPNRVTYFSASQEVLDAFILGLNTDKNWLMGVALKPPTVDSGNAVEVTKEES